MGYKDYLIKRILQLIPTFIGLSILVFVIARVMPGDPVRLALGPEATEEQIMKYRHELGLDKPIYEQYFYFLFGIFQGKLGESLRTFHDVSIDIVRFFPATFELVTFSMVISVVAGVFLGVITAIKRNTIMDHFLRLFALSGVSLPRFWIGIIFMLIFSYYLGILPTTGRIDTHIAPPQRVTGLYLLDSLLTGNLIAFMSSLEHIILPAVTLALSPTAQIMRFVRSSMIEQSTKNYTLTERANSLPENLITFKYMLKNAFSSALTTIGLLYGFLLGNAFVVEQVFAWPGMARYGVQALLHKDFNAIVGVVLVVGAFFLLVNFIIDILYGYLDPRIRYEEETE